MFFFFLYASLSEKIPRNKKVEYIGQETRDKLHVNFTAEQKNEIESTTESHDYKAETTKLLSILIDNLYHNKDVFMRELISNANDALDKIRFEAIRDPSVLDKGSKNLEILIDIDEKEKVLSITDTGIGMTKDELIQNLGSIAKSGTYEFQKMLQSGDTNLIGQFGVGFYSAFLVSDRVTVISKSNNDSKQWIWESDATASFSVTEDPRGNTLGRGTSILLHLKDNAYNYLDRDKIMAIVRHYSMFVDFPVKIWHFKEVNVEEDEVIDTKDDDIFDDDDKVVDDSDDDDDDKKETKIEAGEKKTELKVVWQWIQVNDRKPIWLRKPEEVVESDYNEFFTIYFKEPKGPMLHLHKNFEGRVQFSALFFIPSVPPPAEQLFAHHTRNVRLYVKRVLVSDDWNDELLPDYLHFIKGVIDSNDLTLNVDRDRLVKENSLKLIKAKVTSAILSVIKNMYMEDPLMYADFYSKYGGNIKYGIVDDEKNKRLLSQLLMFYTSYSPKKLTTLDDYLARMKKGQEKIYWIGAASIEEARNSPYTEELLSNGYEVLFAIEPIDVYCFEKMDEYNGIPLDTPEKEKQSQSEEKIQDVSEFVGITQKKFNKLVRWIKKVIGDRIENVVLSKRLKTTPAICTATGYGYTASHERLMRAQMVQDAELADNLIMNRKTLELNFYHPTITDLINRIFAYPTLTNEQKAATVEDTRLLFDAALLAGGYTLGDPLNFTKRVFHMLGRSYDIEPAVSSFENENKVYYPKVEDEFDFEHKGQKFIKLGRKYKTSGDSKDNGDETPADLHPSTPEECYAGIL